MSKDNNFVEVISRRKMLEAKSSMSPAEQDLVERFYNGETLDASALSQLQKIAAKYDATGKRLAQEERKRRQELLEREPDHYE